MHFLRSLYKGNRTARPGGGSGAKMHVSVDRTGYADSSDRAEGGTDDAGGGGSA